MLSNNDDVQKASSKQQQQRRKQIPTTITHTQKMERAQKRVEFAA
jgi:hypothetical protein